MQFEAKIHNRDFLTLKVQEDSHFSIEARGCLELLRAVAHLKASCNSIKDFKAYWETKSSKNHGESLLKELCLKATNSWDLPYKDKELCHCRAVDTDLVVSSIHLGADATDKVGAMCSAGTSCGTCTPDIQSCIEYIR
jgi:bacterioferritin-associated ferredoxin